MDIDFGKEIRNARVKFTWLGPEEDGRVTMAIGFECEGNRTVSTPRMPATASKIGEILSILEVRSWEELPRKFARISISNGKVVSVGNLINESWACLQ